MEDRGGKDIEETTHADVNREDADVLNGYGYKENEAEKAQWVYSSLIDSLTQTIFVYNIDDLVASQEYTSNGSSDHYGNYGNGGEGDSWIARYVDEIIKARDVQYDSMREVKKSVVK